MKKVEFVVSKAQREDFVSALEQHNIAEYATKSTETHVAFSFKAETTTLIQIGETYGKNQERQD